MPDSIEQAPCGYIEFSADTSIVRVNQTLSRWLQRPVEECVGQRFETFLTVANRVFFHTHFFPLIQLTGNIDEIFLSLKCADGTALPVVTSAARTDVGTYQCVFLPVPHRRKYEDEILQARKTAEGALKSNEALNAAKSAAEKHALNLERRIDEVEQRNAELINVSQILSHDLREPTRKIQLFADMTREHVEAVHHPEASEALGKIESEAVRINTLIGAMRQYLQVDTVTPLSSVDLSKIVENAVSTVAFKLSFSEWEVTVDNLPLIQGRPGPLLLLFSELLGNAIKFRHPARKLKVKVTTQVLQQNAFRPESQRYQFVDIVRMTISDNGQSFDPKYAEYVFGLLKKVDIQSPGLGLGLALCKKIVGSHFGSIHAAPEMNVGTAIIVELPIAGA